MCDLGEKRSYPCGTTTEIVFFKQEKPNNVGQKIKTENSEDEETGQIGDKQILPDQTEPDKVEESEAVNGCDQMYNLNYTEWKLKNEELDIKDESETNKNRDTNTRPRTCNSTITDYYQESRPSICSEINNVMVNNLLQETKTTNIDVLKDLSAVEGNLEGCNGQSLSSTLQIKGKHKSLLNAALINIEYTNSIMADFEIENVPLDVPKYSCNKDFIEQGPKLIVVIKRLNISEQNGELITDHNPHQIPCTALNSETNIRPRPWKSAITNYNQESHPSICPKINNMMQNNLLQGTKTTNIDIPKDLSGSSAVEENLKGCNSQSLSSTSQIPGKNKSSLNAALTNIDVPKCCDKDFIKQGPKLIVVIKRLNISENNGELTIDNNLHQLPSTASNSSDEHQDCRFQIQHQRYNQVSQKLNVNVENDLGIFRQRNLYKHGPRKGSGKVKLFKCGQCDYRSMREGYLKSHLLLHTNPAKVNLFKCDQCDYRSIWKGNLKKHLLVHTNPAKANLFKCGQCDFRSIWKRSLKRHLLRHKDTEVVNLFKCDQCDYRSIWKGNLKKHLLVHTNPAKANLFKCGQCDFRSIWKRSLKRHLLRHKDTEVVNLFKCDQCDYRSNWKDCLKRHLLLHMNPAKVNLFKCDQCDYRSMRKDNLKSHLLLHMNPAEVNSFKCDQCDYRSIVKGSLKKHRVLHMNPAKINLFKCGQCEYRSIWKGCLKRHLLRHKDSGVVNLFKCDKCDYRSMRKGYLKSHLLLHMNPAKVNLFECDQCDYRSIWKSSLKRHLLLHTNPAKVKLFKCGQCYYQTTRKGDLNRHRLRHEIQG